MGLQMGTIGQLANASDPGLLRVGRDDLFNMSWQILHQNFHPVNMILQPRSQGDPAISETGRSTGL